MVSEMSGGNPPGAMYRSGNEAGMVPPLYTSYNGNDAQGAMYEQAPYTSHRPANQVRTTGQEA